jgi:hypothetical protein
VFALVKPATLEGGVGGASCTYAELLLAQARARVRAYGPCALCASADVPIVCAPQGSTHVSRATHFVSHAWDSPFADLLAALESYAEREKLDRKAYFWLGAAAVRAQTNAAVPLTCGRPRARRRIRQLSAPGSPASAGVVDASVSQGCGGHWLHRPRAPALARATAADAQLVFVGDLLHARWWR